MQPLFAESQGDQGRRFVKTNRKISNIFFFDDRQYCATSNSGFYQQKHLTVLNMDSYLT